MKLREIIKLSCVMLGLEDLLTSTELYDEAFDTLDENVLLSQGTNTQKNLNLLVKCFNIVNSEIATDYFPLITLEKISVKDGSFKLIDLQNDFYKLIKLEDKDGLSVCYEIYDNILYVKNGEYNLVYCYVPQKLTLNSEVNNFNGKLVDRIFAYGINKEYCFISGLYSEAECYKNKFEDGIKFSKIVRKQINLPKRRWR